MRFKMNHTMQLLKDEQKQQEGKLWSIVHVVTASSAFPQSDAFELDF